MLDEDEVFGSASESVSKDIFEGVVEDEVFGRASESVSKDVFEGVVEGVLEGGWCVTGCVDRYSRVCF